MRRVVAIENDPIVPPGDLARVASAQGIELEVVPAYDAPLPAAGLDGVVVLGGRMGVHDRDRYPYLGDELTWLRYLVEREVPVLGICLGAQLIAEALGGRAYKAPSPEIDVRPVDLTDAGRADPVASAFEGAPVLIMHQDTFDLPPGAILLGATDRYPSAFRLGSALALQPHPEATPPIVERWLTDPDTVAFVRVAGVDPDRLLERLREIEPTRAVLTERSLGRWFRHR